MHPDTASSTHHPREAAAAGGDAPWRLELGATPEGDGTRFAVWAPRSDTVRVRVLDEAGAARAEVPLARGADGLFTGHAAGVHAGADYQLVLDDGRALPDPASRWQPHGVHGPSRVVDPRAFAWSDAGWRGLRSMADYVVYELHVGTYTAAGTYAGVAAQLPALRALGVTAIELLPIAEFPGGRNWGYDGVHLYAPQSTYGGPEELRRLVDAAHREGIAVILDVVYNHLGPEGNYLDAFGPYFTDRYETPWGRAVNVDGDDAAGVRRHLVDNARHWIAEYHVDGLRLDAIHGIQDAGPRHVLAELTDAVRELGASLGRTVHLIAESDLNDVRVVRPTAEGGLGFDAHWADDLHHTVHVALTGETQGYYERFAHVPVTDALRVPYVREGHGFEPSRPALPAAAREESAALPRWHFVVCLQNHDQVGNRATGDRIGTALTHAQRKAAAGVVLLSGYVPMLFMGEEYGEPRPFQYFVSHGDPALCAAVREGRRAEFAGFAWGEDVPDPGAEETFRRSVLAPDEAVGAEHAALRAFYTDVLALRRGEPALRPGVAAVHVAGSDDGLSGTLLFAPVSEAAWPACVAYNLAGEAREVTLPATGRGAWQPALASESSIYLGEGHATSAPVEPGAAIRLPAASVEVFSVGPGA